MNFRVPLYLALVLVWCFNTIKTQNYGDLRIVQRNSTNSSFSAGRLEIYINSTWGSICADNFDIIDAHVACRQLGFLGAVSTDTSFHTPHGRGIDGPVWLDEVECEDQDLLHILSCPNAGIGEHDCDHFSDVAVVCIETSLLAQPRATDVRLVGEDYKSQGVVEVYCSGQWNTLCTLEIFEKIEADVICKQLGFTESRVFETTEILPPEEPILFQQLNCPSGANDIASCGSCSQRDFIANSSLPDCYLYVECVHDVPYGTVRLAQGTEITPDSAEGRVEIFRNGRWGTVCMKGFDEAAANVTCRQLGFMTALKYQSSVEAGFGEGYVPISLSGLNCLPEDETLALCSNKPVNCTHSEDVAVFCASASPPPDEDPSTTEGLSTSTFIGIIVGSCFVLMLCLICVGVCSMHLLLVPYDIKKEEAEHGLYFIEREGNMGCGEHETSLDQKLPDLDECQYKEEDANIKAVDLAVLSIASSPNKEISTSMNTSHISLNTIAVNSPNPHRARQLHTEQATHLGFHNPILTQQTGGSQELPRPAYFPPSPDSPHKDYHISPRSPPSSSLESYQTVHSSPVMDTSLIPIKIPISPILRRQLNKTTSSDPNKDNVTPPRHLSDLVATRNMSELDPSLATQSSKDSKNLSSTSPTLQSTGDGSPLLMSHTSSSTPLTLTSPARGIMKTSKSLETQSMPYLECDQEFLEVYTDVDGDQTLDPEFTQSKHAHPHHVSFRLD